MLSVVLAFVGSLVYGGSDFFGGLASRRMSAIKVTAINSVAGLGLLLLLTAFIPGKWNGEVLLWGGLAGLVGAASLGLLYACLAIGPMSILAPIMALISAIIPIVVGFATGERLDPLGYLGLALGLVAIVLICFVPDARAVRASPRALVMATAAGLAIGLYLVFINRTPQDSGLSPLILTFVVAGAVMGAILLVRRLARGPRRPGTTEATRVTPSRARSAAALAVYSGLTDACAAALFLFALRLGDLSVVAVLSALSPAGTILLAAAFLKERIAPVQWAGLAVALVAAAMLALA